MSDLVAFARAAAEVHDLELLAEQRAQGTARRLEALERFVRDDALPSWALRSRDYHLGVLEVLRALVTHAGRLVTGRIVLAEVELEAYRWAAMVGLVPMIGVDDAIREC
jgi:hypothetical protein